MCNDLPVDIQMHKRVSKFIFCLLESGNGYIKICLQLAINGSTSQMYRTINYVCNDIILVTKIYFLQGLTCGIIRLLFILNLPIPHILVLKS